MNRRQRHIIDIVTAKVERSLDFKKSRLFPSSAEISFLESLLTKLTEIKALDGLDDVEAWRMKTYAKNVHFS